MGSGLLNNVQYPIVPGETRSIAPGHLMKSAIGPERDIVALPETALPLRE